MNRYAFLLLPALGLTLSACQTAKTHLTVTGQGRPSEPLVCSQWLPLTYASRHDTAETVEVLRRHNAKRQAYCH